MRVRQMTLALQCWLKQYTDKCQAYSDLSTQIESKHLRQVPSPSPPKPRAKPDLSCKDDGADVHENEEEQEQPD